MKGSSKYMMISAFTFIAGYLFLRFAFDISNSIPFVQEVVLIILGTIATIAITAALLNKQSEIELDKEQRIKIFELKSGLYFELIDIIERVILKGKINTGDMISLEFLTHKISTIADKEVLLEYSNFLNILKKVASDAEITPLESDELSMALAKLCGKIRFDLISNDKNQAQEIQEIIDRNINKF